MAMRTLDIEYSAGGVEMRGYLCHQDGAKKRPGVAIFHDVWGLGDYVIRRAHMIAELGYVTFAADMYGGRRFAKTHAEAIAYLGPLATDTALMRSRAGAAQAALVAQSIVDPFQLAAIGYCLGGKVVLEMARAGCQLAGVVSLHGGLQTDSPAGPGDVKAKVLVCTGGDDPMVPAEHVVAFQNEMRAAQVNWQVNVYGGAQHAFTVPAASTWGRPGVAYSKSADERSWIDMVNFLNETVT